LVQGAQCAHGCSHARGHQRATAAVAGRGFLHGHPLACALVEYGFVDLVHDGENWKKSNRSHWVALTEAQNNNMIALLLFVILAIYSIEAKQTVDAWCFCIFTENY
jgi:hypothetical protein